MACNCEDNKCYNISMGCVVPIVANADNYYTKSEIDEKIDDIITSGCCITPEEVDEKIASAKTEIEGEIPSLSGYATEQWVLDQNYISGVDLSDYATKDFVSGYTYDKETIDEKVAGGGTFDPTQYYTTANTYNKTEVDNLIPTIPTSNTAFTNDAGYLTQHQPIKTINNNVLVGTGNVQLDIPKIWHGTKQEYDAIVNKDADTIYLLYES